MPTDLLHARRVLVVEDEYLLAMELSRELTQAGAAVAGPVATVARALSLLDDELDIAAAVLDVSLGGEKVYPVADVLLGRKVPFVFMTGYETAVLGARYAGVRRCEKPLDPALLVGALATLLDQGESGPGAMVSGETAR